MSDQISSDLASLRIDRDAPPPSTGGKKTLVVLALMAALGVAGWVAFERVRPQIFKEQVSTTEVVMISPAQSQVLVTSTGYVVPQVWSKIGAKIMGRLAKVNVKEGDQVKAGDVIAVLDDADQKSAIAAATSRVTVARARGQSARANLAEVSQQVARQKTLVESGAAPRAQLEDLSAREQALREVVKASDAEAQAAQAEVDSLRVSLQDRTILSPINGTVLSKPQAVGETVGFQTAAAYVAEIADFSSIVVETDVPEARLDLIKAKSPCEIVLDAYPTRRYRGYVESIGKRVNRAKATATVKVKFKDDMEGVLPDMSARVSFLREEISVESLKEKPKKVVAADAVTERGGAKVVFIVEDGKLRMVPVSVGVSMGSSLELLDGPPPGARVVSKPSTLLMDGIRIKESEK